MIPIASPDQIRQIEAEANAAGLSYDEMMQRAGQAVADRALSVLRNIHVEQLNDADARPRVTILVGKGKNGGDGIIAGQKIASSTGANSVVRLYTIGRDIDDPLLEATRNEGIFIARAEDDQRHRVLAQLVASADLIIDAIYGIGARLPVSQDVAAVLKSVKKELVSRSELLIEVDKQSSITSFDYLRRFNVRRCTIIALDCPSGVDCLNGEIDPNALYADMTVTFIAAKPGLLLSPALRAVGELIVESLDIDSSLLNSIPVSLVTYGDVVRLFPNRPIDGNKGTFGKILIAGGSTRYRGAPVLAAQAAYHSGAGLVTIASTHTVVDALAPALLEATWLPLAEQDGLIAPEALSGVRESLADHDVLVIGCGLSKSDGLRDALLTLLAEAKARDLPCVIDADALNMLAEVDRFWEHLPPRAVLTPHPGEMARLSGMSIEAIQADRLNVAQQFATQWGAIVLLKGAHTVIADAKRTSVLPFKTSALSKAGTGDVLAGTIGAFLHTVPSVHDAAVLGSYIHGAAGSREGIDYWGGIDLLATDLIYNYGVILNALAGHGQLYVIRR